MTQETVDQNHEFPLVSVVIPAWNCSNSISETIESVIGQTWPCLDIHVVDDGSTDDTPAVVGQYKDHITFHRISNSGGPSRPRNVGTLASRGEFVALFDSDDVMDPEKIHIQMDVFRNHPEVDLVCSSFRAIDTEGQVIKDDWLEDYVQFRLHGSQGKKTHTLLMKGSDVFSQLIRANFIGTSSVLCRKKAMIDVGLFDETMTNSDDIEMWYKLARNDMTFAFVDRTLYSYRLNPNGITHRGWKRFPNVIKGLRRQIPHCRSDEDRILLERKIHSIYSGYAWALAKEGMTDDAIEAYHSALEFRYNLRTLLSLCRLKVKRMLNPSD